MVQLNKFKGNLLHNIIVTTDVLLADTLATVTTVESDFDIEIFPSSCLQLCIGALPVLKGIRAHFQVNDGALADLAVIAAEGFLLRASIWNLDASFIPAELFDGDPHFECFGMCELTIQELDGTATLDIERNEKILQKNYGIDGVLLRPGLSARIRVQNATGSGINKDLFALVLELDIDWVPISETEWDEYLRELWLVQSFGD
jgi:hypothetical protein